MRARPHKNDLRVCGAQLRIKADLSQQPKVATPCGECWPKPSSERPLGKQRRGHNLQVDRPGVGRNCVSEATVKRSDLSTPPIQPGVFDTSRHQFSPLREPPAARRWHLDASVGHKAGHRGIIKAPGDTWEMEPAIMRAGKRETTHGRSIRHPVGQVNHQLLDSILHPRIQHVVADPTICSSGRLAICAHTLDPHSGAATSEPQHLEGCQRSAAFNRGHELKSFPPKHPTEQLQKIF
jgi:hypothetical protein